MIELSKLCITLKASLMEALKAAYRYMEAGSPQEDSGAGEESKPNLAGPIAILSFILFVVVGIITLILCVRCKQRNVIEREKKGDLINYKIPLGQNLIANEGIRGRLNDVSTGSPNIAAWDLETNAVAAEKYLTAI